MSASSQPPRDEDPHVGIRDLRHNLSEFIRRAANGETIVVTDRGRAVARLVPEPVVPGNAIERGIANGSIRPATLSKEAFLALPALKRAPGSPTMGEILAQMRDEERY